VPSILNRQSLTFVKTLNVFYRYALHVLMFIPKNINNRRHMVNSKSNTYLITLVFTKLLMTSFLT